MIFDIPDFDDPPVTCPYNESHKICKSRIQRHLVKCEKNYPVGYKVLCPYDGSHRVFPSELKDHTETCTARKLLENEYLEDDISYKSLTVRSHSEIKSLPDETEDWDKEDNQSRISIGNFNRQSNGGRKFCKSFSENKVKQVKSLRPPHGYSEAMLRDTEDDVPFADSASVSSSMAIGRGKHILQSTQSCEKMGRGGGSALK